MISASLLWRVAPLAKASDFSFPSGESWRREAGLGAPAFFHSRPPGIGAQRARPRGARHYPGAALAAGHHVRIAGGLHRLAGLGRRPTEPVRQSITRPARSAPRCCSPAPFRRSRRDGSGLWWRNTSTTPAPSRAGHGGGRSVAHVYTWGVGRGARGDRRARAVGPGADRGPARDPDRADQRPGSEASTNSRRATRKSTGSSGRGSFCKRSARSAHRLGPRGQSPGRSYGSGLFATASAVCILLLLSHDAPFTGRVSVSVNPLLEVRPQ